MSTSPIVEHFDAIVDLDIGHTPSLIGSLLDSFLLQAAQERFVHCILPCIYPAVATPGFAPSSVHVNGKTVLAPMIMWSESFEQRGLVTRIMCYGLKEKTIRGLRCPHILSPLPLHVKTSLHLIHFYDQCRSIHRRDFFDTSYTPFIRLCPVQLQHQK